MAQYVRDVMTEKLVALDIEAPVADAAELMLKRDIGAVIVTDEWGILRGIVTDRDIVVRCVAHGKNPNETVLGDICSSELNTLPANEEIDAAVLLMRENGVRRLPIEAEGEIIGIVSLGDLARARDPKSVLGAVSARPPNR